jgi:hypothetical protein
MGDAAELRNQICKDKSKCDDHGAVIPTSLTAEDLCSIKGGVSTLMMKEDK